MASSQPENIRAALDSAAEARADQEMAVLSQRYAGECRRVILTIQKDFGDGNSLTRRRLLAIQLKAHNLVGAASIFGFPEVSQAAGALSLLLRPVVSNPDLPAEPDIAEMAKRVTALVRTIPPRRQARRARAGNTM